MEKKSRRQIEKNVRLKDRGDMLRKNILKDLESQRTPPDRGDIKRVRKKRTKVDDNKPETVIPEEHKVDMSTNTEQEPESKVIDKVEPEFLEYRQKIRQRYTRRPKVAPKNEPKTEELEKNDDQPPAKLSNELRERSKSIESHQTKSDRASLTENSGVMKRKPIIKTITSKNDRVRVYKAVTFVDQKTNKPLHIKMPVSQSCPRKSKSSLPKLANMKVQVVPSKVSIAEKPVKRKKKTAKAKREKKYLPKPIFVSPEVSSAKIVSPRTEVSKWAPSMEKHSMPYYEAWVNTTLAAVSKYSEKDKPYLEKQKILQTFKRQLKDRRRDLSPELVYENLRDERYIGKIKVHQRDQMK